ncbi:MAG: polysaccharide pyruvyl transferase family protein [Clostridia bacterium]|nr:polysaccharide pyruvyl transferase family protein [Clostridia bacterium]
MKILMLTDKMDIGGAETHIVTLIRELRKMGVEITLISGGGVYIKDLLPLGIRCVTAPLGRRDPASIISSYRAVKREMKLCHIVHAHTRFTANLAKSIRGSGAWPPILVTAHLDFPPFPYGRRCFFGDLTLAVSEDIKAHLIKAYRVNEKKIRLTKNGLDLSAFSGAPTTKKLIIHTSRIDRGRSLAAIKLAEAAPELLARYPEYKILIIGDGNDMDRLKRAAGEANSALGCEGVILTGKRSDIPSILKYGSIFVGASRAALEAMASGLATVIAGDEGFGGIIDGENFSALAYSNFCARGLPETTKEGLTKAISELIDSPKRRSELALFYKSRLTLEYSAESMAKDALDAYHILKRSPRVCLMGYFGFSNLGDEITLYAATEALMRRGITDITVLTEKPDTYIGRGIKLYNRGSFSDINEAINGSDIFVMCGGNLLQNETGQLSLLYYNEIMELAKMKGKSVYMISSGFGEVKGALGKFLLTRGIRCSSFCGCRTEYDLKIARLLGQSNATLMPDLCFLLTESEKGECKKLFAYIPSGKAALTKDELLKIGRARGLSPIVIILFPEKDRQLAADFSDAGISCYFPKSYTRVGELLSACAFSICERLHGAIFSILNHTPAYISERSAKNRALLDEVSRHGASLLLPYDKDRVLTGEETNVTDADFKRVIKLFRDRVSKEMENAF